MRDKPMPRHLQTGRQAEQQALQFLQQQGLRWRASNVRYAVGELDLVMQDGATVVMVEVRYRQSQRYGGALASITPRKQARIIAAAQHYVIIQGLTTAAIRFDVVALSGDQPIQWIQNAFLT